MRRDYERLFSKLESREPPSGLFDRIISAIRRERELRQTRRLLFGFASLAAVSLVALPVSGAMLASQIRDSGIVYFVLAVAGDFRSFPAVWQDFSLAVLESLPTAGMLVFVASLAVSVFALRLFLHRKRLLLGYLINN